MFHKVSLVLDVRREIGHGIDEKERLEKRLGDFLHEYGDMGFEEVENSGRMRRRGMVQVHSIVPSYL
jgi:hypothetical protein